MESSLWGVGRVSREGLPGVSGAYLLFRSDSCSGLPRKITRSQLFRAPKENYPEPTRMDWPGLLKRAAKPGRLAGASRWKCDWTPTFRKRRRCGVECVDGCALTCVCACACACALVCLGVRIPDDGLSAVAVRDTAMMTLQGVWLLLQMGLPRTKRQPVNPALSWGHFGY